MLCTCIFLLLQLKPDNFYVHEVTLVFLQRGVFQLDVKSMTPSDDVQGGADDPNRLSSRTSSGNEAVLSRSPIRKVSQQSNKNRPSLQQKNEKLSTDKKGNKSENSRRSSRSSGGSQSSDGGSQSSKEKNYSKNSPSVLPKKPKPPVASQGASGSSSSSSSSNKRPVSGGEETNSRTNSTGNDPSTVLPSAYVAKMVSMIERRGTPPPVPTSARPKLKATVTNADHQPMDPSTVTGNSNQITKKLYPTINGSSALAKPVPLSQPLNSSSNSSGGSNPSSSRGMFTAQMEERQRGEQACQDKTSSTTIPTPNASKGSKSSMKHKRLGPEKLESVILLSSNSRSQNLWNARLQSSVRLLSGPHFTFNVT